jgi:hypothetical protein
MLPIYYMWINASCHSYLLPEFEVNPMFVPTVVFYLPEKDKSAHLIGKFDKETIQKHEQRFASGKLPTFAMKTRAGQIEIRDLDCPNIQPELELGESDSEFEDEILKEILREDEERRKRVAQEEAEFKKKKPNKKKKKANQKDDL